jgi:hypothetical protein
MLSRAGHGKACPHTGREQLLILDDLAVLVLFWLLVRIRSIVYFPLALIGRLLVGLAGTRRPILFARHIVLRIRLDGGDEGRKKRLCPGLKVIGEGVGGDGGNNGDAKLNRRQDAGELDGVW